MCTPRSAQSESESPRHSTQGKNAKLRRAVPRARAKKSRLENRCQEWKKSSSIFFESLSCSTFYVAWCLGPSASRIRLGRWGWSRRSLVCESWSLAHESRLLGIPTVVSHSLGSFSSSLTVWRYSHTGYTARVRSSLGTAVDIVRDTLYHTVVSTVTGHSGQRDSRFRFRLAAGDHTDQRPSRPKAGTQPSNAAAGTLYARL